MTEDNTRLDRAFAVLEALQQPGPYPVRLAGALPALTGLQLSGASDLVRQAVEAFGLQYNAITRGYPTQASPEHPAFNEEDARELTTSLHHVATVTRDSETERILSRLRHHRGNLPEAEIREMRRHQGWFIPRLMQESREQIAKVRELPNPDDRLPKGEHSSIPFFSLFLFSEWNVTESVSVILEAIQLPGEGPFELFGDAIHEQMPRYLAQFLPDDLDQIDTFVCDSHLGVFVRWSSAASYRHLVRDKKLSVDDAVARLDQLFHKTKVSADDGSPGLGHPYEVSAGIIEVILSIGGASRSTVAGEDHNWEYIDESIIGREEFDEPPESADDGNLTSELVGLRPTRVEDCLEELHGWATFEPRPKPVPRPAAPRPSRPAPKRKQPVTPIRTSPPASEKPIQQSKRVSRNAPCPCGSGKKYKQCCLRK